MDIFREDMDYEVFITLLRKVLNQYGGTIHAYCLMTNHYHILIETEQEEIWKFVKMFSQQYAMYYNQKNGYKGHLFENRYKSCIVKDDAYFLQTSRYIHLNPIKARIVNCPEEYRWSSYRTMIGMTDDRITTTLKTLSYFGKKPVKNYRDFVDDIGHKYLINEDCIKRGIGEDDLWLPW